MHWWSYIDTASRLIHQKQASTYDCRILLNTQWIKNVDLCSLILLHSPLSSFRLHVAYFSRHIIYFCMVVDTCWIRLECNTCFQSIISTLTYSGFFDLHCYAKLTPQGVQFTLLFLVVNVLGCLGCLQLFLWCVIHQQFLLLPLWPVMCWVLRECFMSKKDAEI